MGMTQRERRIWLSEITRINTEQRKLRIQELMDYSEFLKSLRKEQEAE